MLVKSLLTIVTLEVLLDMLVHPQQQSHTAAGQVTWGITMLLEVEIQQLTMKYRKLHSTQQQ